MGLAHSMALSAAQAILNSLTLPSQTLVFCDDTNIPGSPVTSFVNETRMLGAIVMSSSDYEVALGVIAELLVEVGVDEFHAADLVNPKSGSAWKAIPDLTRARAFRSISDITLRSVNHFYYAYVSKEQYVELRQRAEAIAPVSVGAVAGLKRVFLRSLFEKLDGNVERVAIVMDQDRPLIEPVIELWPEGSFAIGGGPIAADSKAVPGLQIADMAVYSVCRYLIKRPALREDAGSVFDRIALETVAGLGVRISCLL